MNVAVAGKAVHWTPRYHLSSFQRGAFRVGEMVSITDPPPGVTACFWWQSGQLQCDGPEALHYVAGDVVEIEELCRANPGLGLYGVIREVGRAAAFTAIDIWDNAGFWYDADKLRGICDRFFLTTAPVIYRGRYDPAIVSRIREKHPDAVIRTLVERHHPRVGRLCFRIQRAKGG